MTARSLCFNCGHRARLMLDGSPLCDACLEAVLKPMRRSGVLQLVDGTPTDLEACPACGAVRSAVMESGYLGCPSCYVVFRVATRRMLADREV